MDTKIFELYTLAELSYQKHFKDIYAKENLYPIDWYENKDYKEKINIIGEAIKENQLIKDTTSYKKLVLTKK